MPAKPKREFTISSNAIKWAIGALVGVLSMYAGWKVVWSDIDSHWRQEAIQKAVDEKVASDIKGAREKADADIKSAREKADADTKAVAAKTAADMAVHKLSEARGNAWQTWALQDFRAAAEQQWFKQCLRDTKEKGGCADQEARAYDAKQQAQSAKSAASELSKEK